MKHWLTVMSVVLMATTAAHAEDLTDTFEVDGVAIAIWIPAGDGPLRGLFVNPADNKIGGNSAWSETARPMRFGMVGMLLKDRNRNNRPRILTNALAASLLHFAEKHDRPELPSLPFCAAGMSAGGGWSAHLAQALPERAIAFANVVGWVADPEKDLTAPGMVVIGKVPDGFKMLESIDTQYLPARAKQAPWSLALQPGCAHDYGNANALAMPFFQRMVADRLPAKLGEPLRPVRLEEGWLVARAELDSPFAAIHRWEDYPGDRAQAIWLPNAYLAHVWRAFVVERPAVTIEATTSAGQSLPPAQPKTKRNLVVGAAETITLRAAVPEGTVVTDVRFFDGDRELARVATPPYTFDWRPDQAGPHAVYVQYTLDGQPRVSNPGLIVVRGQ